MIPAILYEVACDILEIAKKSPEHGNALMDIIGEDACQVAFGIAKEGSTDEKN